jgi:LysW-gamma-L-lysine carboxypeptidase
MDARTLLREMVEIYSPSGEEGEIGQYLVSVMGSMGMNAYLDDVGNAVGDVGQGHPHVMLLGHMDTVPGFIQVEERDSILYGRGSVDAKGPLAAFIIAVSRQMPVQRGRVTVVGAVDEESTTSLGAYRVVEDFNPDYAVIGEPSGWDSITLGYKGRLLVNYRLSRPVSHSAGQYESACEEAVAFWERLRRYTQEYNADKEGNFSTLHLSLRNISSSSDGLTQEVEQLLAFRIPFGVELADVEAFVTETAGDGTVAFSSQEVPYRAAKNTPVVRVFLHSIRDAGGRPTFKVKTGTSDMNVVGPVWNCPLVAYGPGDSTLDHTPQEHQDLKEYDKGIEVLTGALGKLLQEEELR